MNNGTQVLPIDLGKREEGFNFNVDLARMPNLLIGGARGQGKTVMLNQIITSIATKLTPEEVRFVLYDHSCVEFMMYSDMPHLLQPVINSPQKMVLELERLETDVESRLSMFAKARCRNLTDFNARKNRESDGQPKAFPYVVVVADDMTELMFEYGDQASRAIRRLTSRARAAGIHLVMSVRVMDQQIMRGFTLDSFPVRIAFKTWSEADSAAIVGVDTAVALPKPGDFIFREGVRKAVSGRTEYNTFAKLEESLEMVKKTAKGMEKDFVRFWR